jgi:hypothetical protein
MPLRRSPPSQAPDVSLISETINMTPLLCHGDVSSGMTSMSKLLHLFYDDHVTSFLCHGDVAILRKNLYHVYSTPCNYLDLLFTTISSAYIYRVIQAAITNAEVIQRLLLILKSFWSHGGL